MLRSFAPENVKEPLLTKIHVLMKLFETICNSYTYNSSVSKCLLRASQAELRERSDEVRSLKFGRPAEPSPLREIRGGEEKQRIEKTS